MYETQLLVCISYYMACGRGPQALRHYCASIWHMHTRGHVISNLLHDNGMAAQYIIYWHDNGMAVQYIIYWHDNGMAVQYIIYWHDNELAVQYIIYWHSEPLI